MVTDAREMSLQDVVTSINEALLNFTYLPLVVSYDNINCVTQKIAVTLFTQIW